MLHRAVFWPYTFKEVIMNFYEQLNILQSKIGVKKLEEELQPIQNEDALNKVLSQTLNKSKKFSSLSKEQKTKIANHIKDIHSKTPLKNNEVVSIIEKLVANNTSNEATPTVDLEPTKKEFEALFSELQAEADKLCKQWESIQAGLGNEIVKKEFQKLNHKDIFKTLRFIGKVASYIPGLQPFGEAAAGLFGFLSEDLSDILPNLKKIPTKAYVKGSGLKNITEDKDITEQLAAAGLTDGIINKVAESAPGQEAETLKLLAVTAAQAADGKPEAFLEKFGPLVGQDLAAKVVESLKNSELDGQDIMLALNKNEAQVTTVGDINKVLTEVPAFSATAGVGNLSADPTFTSIVTNILQLPQQLVEQINAGFGKGTEAERTAEINKLRNEIVGALILKDANSVNALSQRLLAYDQKYSAAYITQLQANVAKILQDANVTDLSGLTNAFKQTQQPVQQKTSEHFVKFYKSLERMLGGK